MTQGKEGGSNFDIRQSVRGRNVTRLIVAPLMAIIFIWFGVWLIPNSTIFRLHVDAIKTWNAWSFVGLVFVGSGLLALLKELAFAVRARSSAGEWHFRLLEDELLWQVPDHAHGKEVGFHVLLGEVKQIEYRLIQKEDGIDERQYWVHFNAGEPIQLQSYSGVSLSWLVERIRNAGVPYVETAERY